VKKPKDDTKTARRERGESLLSDPKVRERFDSSAQAWEDASRSASEAIRASERLTERDFAVRINTR